MSEDYRLSLVITKEELEEEALMTLLIRYASRLGKDGFKVLDYLEDYNDSILRLSPGSRKFTFKCEKW